MKKISGTTELNLTADELLSYMDEIQEEVLHEAPIFEVLQNLKGLNMTKGEVCIRSFADYELGTLIDLEASCFNYHCLPYEGGLLDQPSILLEVFNVIRGEINKYEKVRADKLLSKTQSSNPGNKGRG